MIGRIIKYDTVRNFGFVETFKTDLSGARYGEQYFFHRSNFKADETPVLNGIVVFMLGEPYSTGKKVQAVGVRYATAAEIQQAETPTAGLDVLANAKHTTTTDGVQVTETKIGGTN